MSDWYSAKEREPTGLFDFLGAPEDTGAEVGDRLGVISQILMNLGSGRGGVGVGEAMSRLSERSTERRDRRQMARMANRMADKIEQTNPDLAAVIRSNHKLGLELAGKMALMPIEFAQEKELATMRGDVDLDKALKLAREKRKFELEDADLWRRSMGLRSRTVPEQTSDTGGIPTDAIIANDPNTASLGTGEGEVQITPLSATSVVTPPVTPDQPVEAPQVPPEYLVGLPKNPALADELLSLRLHWEDPDMPLEDMMLLNKSGGSENHVGFDDFRKAVNERKELRQRTAQFEARTKAFNVAPQGPSLPDDPDMPKPGQAELLQAGIDPLTVPLPQQAQDAAYLKQAYKTGDKDYTAALKDLRPNESQGITVYDPATGKPILQMGGKPGTTKSATADENKAGVYYDQAAGALVELNKPESVAALSTPSMDTLNAMLTPEGLQAILTSDQFSAAQKSALAFTEAVVRYKSGAQITPSELAMNYQIFIPQAGEMNKPKTLGFKKRMREKILRSIGSKRSIDAITEDGWDDLNTAIENGNIEPGERYVPPMAQWAIDAEITPEEWAAGKAEFWFPTDQKKTEEE